MTIYPAKKPPKKRKPKRQYSSIKQPSYAAKVKAAKKLRQSSKPVKPRNKKRHDAELLRAYGPPERRAWIKSLPCVICHTRPSENAHVVTGGMGRKADADKIVPLCKEHHAELHREGIDTFQTDYSVFLEAMAARYDAAWKILTEPSREN